MAIALQHCNITVNDVDEAIGFYGKALGLQVRNDVASGGFRWVTLGSDTQPGLDIVLSVPHAGRSQADGDALQELLTKGVLPMMIFRSDDLDATFEALRASGAEILQEPSISRGASATARSATPRATLSGSRRRPRRNSR
jgi:predicted enzyme related to lactoylglutathione lyase